MVLHRRNVRTHSLHDPAAHKRAEVGRYALSGELPSVSTPAFFLCPAEYSLTFFNTAELVHLVAGIFLARVTAYNIICEIECFLCHFGLNS